MKALSLALPGREENAALEIVCTRQTPCAGPPSPGTRVSPWCHRRGGPGARGTARPGESARAEGAVAARAGGARVARGRRVCPPVPPVPQPGLACRPEWAGTGRNARGAGGPGGRPRRKGPGRGKRAGPCPSEGQVPTARSREGAPRRGADGGRGKQGDARERQPPPPATPALLQRPAPRPPRPRPPRPPDPPGRWPDSRWRAGRGKFAAVLVPGCLAARSPRSSPQPATSGSARPASPARTARLGRLAQLRAAAAAALSALPARPAARLRSGRPPRLGWRPPGRPALLPGTLRSRTRPRPQPGPDSRPGRERSSTPACQPAPSSYTWDTPPPAPSASAPPRPRTRPAHPPRAWATHPRPLVDSRRSISARATPPAHAHLNLTEW